MAEAASYLTITGRVQGVFYRDWAAQAANRLGVTGWIRNRSDGSVEAFVQGSEDALARFVKAAETGPPGARVDFVARVPGADEPLSGFEVRPDA